MRRTIALLVAFGLLATTTASAQFVDNGGEAGSADTSAFGQANSFSNLTTKFDGVEFQLQRLIRDPKDKTKLRMIAQLINTGDSDRWISFILPFPELVDELGNRYPIGINAVENNSNGAPAVAGVDGCYEYGQWSDDVRECAGQSATRLAPGVPVILMIGFEPADENSYDASLAAMATFAGLNLRFAVSAADMAGLKGNTSDIESAISVHQVIVPQVPMPAQQQ